MNRAKLVAGKASIGLEKVIKSLIFINKKGGITQIIVI